MQSVIARRRRAKGKRECRRIGRHIAIKCIVAGTAPEHIIPSPPRYRICGTGGKCRVKQCVAGVMGAGQIIRRRIAIQKIVAFTATHRRRGISTHQKISKAGADFLIRLQRCDRRRQADRIIPVIVINVRFV